MVKISTGENVMWRTNEDVTTLVINNKVVDDLVRIKGKTTITCESLLAVTCWTRATL
ncbi:hypothetical protein EPUS_05328 [Endocarpon pusillum Z07020]|uniref:Uncharacterized protein n=1 Tax=Endocarpon pusillum (strain Z07020 / HMAS-L-300199) TaxID=1263415 RepID=U1GHJ5_ENDPU|nr:uncharacterized protein EPUS_05328 [Endocarpon pusillum Z07020]ERF71276.1 hypothetical protein EPUS_05328 [Endocarpon pusillum Z07020]